MQTNSSPENAVNLGKCPNEACRRRGSPGDVDTHCCGVTETQTLTVTCPYIEYEIEQVTECGCTECTANRAKQVSTVRGQVYFVKVDDEGNEILTEPTTLIRFTVGATEHSAIAGGSFVLYMEQTMRNLALKFPAKDNYMTQVVSIDLLDDVDEYTVTVKLPPKPDPVQINPAVENSIKSSWENHGSVYEIVIPPNSFVDNKGDIVSEDIDVFVTFMDPTDTNSMALAPGEFSFLDDEGLERPLVTYGVINMAATTKSGNEVQQSGDLILEIDGEALGLSEEDIADTHLWQIDLDSGGWNNPSPLATSTRLTRKPKALQSVIHSGVPLVNIDRPHWKKPCYVMVRGGNHFDLPGAGQRFDLHTMPSGDCMCGMKTAKTTNAAGLLCGSVECGNTFEIASQSEDMSPGIHKVPSDFIYRNERNGHVIGLAPFEHDITDGSGPVHRGDLGTCNKIKDITEDDNYFLFLDQIENLLPFPRPDNFNDNRVCFIRANFLVNIYHYHLFV